MFTSGLVTSGVVCHKKKQQKKASLKGGYKNNTNLLGETKIKVSNYGRYRVII